MKKSFAQNMYCFSVQVTNLGEEMQMASDYPVHHYKVAYVKLIFWQRYDGQYSLEPPGYFFVALQYSSALLVLSGTLWHSLVFSSTFQYFWYFLVSTLRYSVVLFGTLWYSSVLSDSLWYSPVLSGTLW